MSRQRSLDDVESCLEPLSLIHLFDSATGKSRVTVRLTFHVVFRASWVDDGRALVVNRSDPIFHIVMFDRLWVSELAQRP